jgi:hypothetical protein
MYVHTVVDAALTFIPWHCVRYDFCPLKRAAEFFSRSDPFPNDLQPGEQRGLVGWWLRNLDTTVVLIAQHIDILGPLKLSRQCS